MSVACTKGMVVEGKKASTVHLFVQLHRRRDGAAGRQLTELIQAVEHGTVLSDIDCRR